MIEGREILSNNKPPQFTKKLQSINICEGSPFEFVCHVLDEPSLRVTWMKDGKTDLPGKYITTVEDGACRLYCENSSLFDAGRFVCVARNASGEKRSMAGLVVSKNIYSSSSSSASSSQHGANAAKVTVDKRRNFEIMTKPPVLFNSRIQSSSSSTELDKEFEKTNRSPSCLMSNTAAAAAAEKDQKNLGLYSGNKRPVSVDFTAVRKDFEIEDELISNGVKSSSVFHSDSPTPKSLSNKIVKSQFNFQLSPAGLASPKSLPSPSLPKSKVVLVQSSKFVFHSSVVGETEMVNREKSETKVEPAAMTGDCPSIFISKIKAEVEEGRKKDVKEEEKLDLALGVQFNNQQSVIKNYRKEEFVDDIDVKIIIKNNNNKENLNISEEIMNIIEENINIDEGNLHINEENMNIDVKNLHINEENMNIDEENININDQNQNINEVNINIIGSNQNLKDANSNIIVNNKNINDECQNNDQYIKDESQKCENDEINLKGIDFNKSSTEDKTEITTSHAQPKVIQPFLEEILSPENGDDTSESNLTSLIKSIQIFLPEVLNLQPEDLHVLRGSAIRLVASFIPSPADIMTVKWFKGTKEMTSDDRVQITTTDSSSELEIVDSLPLDSECYTIVVENDFGRDQMSSSVTVEDKPEPPFGQPYVASVTATSLVLSWYGTIFDGASPLLAYKIEQLQLSEDEAEPAECESETDTRWKVISDSCEHTTYQVTELVADQRYKFRISCGNKHGFGRPGLASDTVRMLKSNQEGALSFSPKHVVIDPARKFSSFYILGDILGRGKFGVVQECHDKSSNQKYAAKVIRLKSGQNSEFRQEVEVMNRLNHPKLLQIWDAFESKREAVLVTELIKGRELLERITTEDYTLTERDCAYYTKQICQAVDYMHSKNVLHLDLKLENVLCLTQVSKQIKIIDFGLSKIIEAGVDLKVMSGTPEFVAPEVVSYDPVYPPTDMWSVGVMCYILLSGFSPFSGDSESETLCNVTKAQYDFDEGFDEVSKFAKDFIESLLVKDPKKRMTSSESLKHDWMNCAQADSPGVKLSTAQHKKFLARRKWQKSGNALRALSRLIGDSKSFQRPRGMSVDRKTFLQKLLSRNSSRDSALASDVFDSCSSPPVSRTTSIGFWSELNEVEEEQTECGKKKTRPRSKSCGNIDLVVKMPPRKKKPSSKTLSLTGPARLP